MKRARHFTNIQNIMSNPEKTKQKFNDRLLIKCSIDYSFINNLDI